MPGSFGANPSPSGIGTNLTPNFSWTDPPNAGSYTYSFNLQGSPYWSIPGTGQADFSSSINSLTWGVDPTGGGNQPSDSSMISGHIYEWYVAAWDSNGNDSVFYSGYYPDYSHLTLPAANPPTLGSATVGQSYSGTIIGANGNPPYTFVVNGLSDGLTYSSSGTTLTISGTPIAAGTASFQVRATDGFLGWGPITYTISVGN